MTDKILFWAATITSSLALLLFVTNTSLINGNSTLQGGIGQRQLTINTAQTVLPLYRELSNAIYNASVKNNDEKLVTLLTSQGFTLPSKADKEKAPQLAESTKAQKAAPSKKSIEE